MEEERLVIRIRQPEDTNHSVVANEVSEGLPLLIRNGITQDEQRHDENERQKNIQKRSNIMWTKAALMSWCDSRRKFLNKENSSNF